MDAFDCVIKKDIRNNQIVRELDRVRHRELWRWVAIGTVFAGLLLYSAWQDFELLRHGYQIEKMEMARKQEEEVNRHLRLQIQTLKAPQRIEKIALQRLRMIAPGRDEAIVLERAVAAEPPPHSVLARDREEGQRVGPGS
jgi:cell division protein FtsL